MIWKFKAVFNGRHWKVRVFVAPSSELTANLTGTLTLDDRQWVSFKNHLREAMVTIEERKED